MGSTDGKQAPGITVNTISHQENANYNHKYIAKQLLWSQKMEKKIVMALNPGKESEKLCHAIHVWVFSMTQSLRIDFYNF